MKKNLREVYTNLKIQEWAKDDRPREKLVNLGSHALSDAELLGILIGSGTQHISAVDLGKHILKEHDHNLSHLARRSVIDLVKFKGIGHAKAVAIVSAIELAKRMNNKLKDGIQKIHTSKKAYQLMKPRLFGKLTEEFWVILLNRNNCVAKICQISKGGIAKTTVDPKVVFKNALDYSASSIILVHNHPSGNLKPSQADIALTTNLQKGANMLGLKVFDHIIFTDHGYFSFADQDLVID